MKTEGYNRESKYGSRRIADTGYHKIEGHVIEIVTIATFTILEEEGNAQVDGAAVAQVDTVTLTGTSGTIGITGPAGLSKVVAWDTDLDDTATAFVTAHAAAYALHGITVTAGTATIIFTAATAGFGFRSPTAFNRGGDLAGTTVNTTASAASPLTKHGIIATHPAGEKIYADTKFVRVRLSAGAINVY